MQYSSYSERNELVTDPRSTEMRGLFPPQESYLPPPACMSLRSRKETATRDTVNARQFEHWQTDTPVLQSDSTFMRPRQLGMPSIVLQSNAVKKTNIDVVYDMNPLSSRLDPRNFTQARSFDEMGPSLALNPFFDRYDPTRDPRNAVRELRSVVNEDNYEERGVKVSRHLLERGFNSRWVPEGYAEHEKMDTLLAYETIRPKQDSWEKSYRSNVEITGTLAMF